MENSVGFRAGFNCHRPCDTVPEGVSLTKQSFRDESDINMMMDRFQKTGVLDEDRVPVGARYIDCTGILSYQESLQVVTEAEEAFNGLDAKVRRRFDNDPAQMIAFLQDPASEAEARDLGLLEPKAPAAEASKEAVSS